MSRGAARRLDEAWARSPHMVGRRIGEEYVLVPLAGRGADLDSILNLNRVAAFVWEQLDGETSGSDVVAAVVERFDVERARAEQDYLELVDTLVEVGAVFSAARAAGLSVPAPRASLARLAGALAYQQVMLADARRNRAFRRALAARVRPGTSVLDLGAGTGVWAVAAARLGARRVVAVEREAVLVPVIEALAREAGVSDRVEVVRADARRVRLRREFDLVVGELVGNEAFEEGLVPVFERARRHFLRPGGALVPEWVSLVAAPVVAPSRLGLSPPFLPSASVAALTGHIPRNLHPERAAAARARARAAPARPAHGARRRSSSHGPGELPRQGRPRGGRHRGVGGDGARPGRQARDPRGHALAADAAADRAAASRARPARGRDRLERRAAALVDALLGREWPLAAGALLAAVRLGLGESGASRASPSSLTGLPRGG